MSHFERIEAVFHQAADLAHDERGPFLDQACNADAALRAEVESLLESMDTDLTAPIAAAAAMIELPDHTPEQLGTFRIVSVLGEGGMGRVYEARQESPDRSVALKVIRPGLVSRTVQKRFHHEAQVLGQLKHAGIAQVYQAGTLPSTDGVLGGGQPYFAMELVRGPHIGEYVKAEGLDVHATLELLARVCDAVQHAHQRGVIHRDLKPGNILVEGSGHDAQPKVLDFGIARLVDDSDLARQTQHTEAGQIVGTLAYMSPEQIEGDRLHIDTRADVYALGVIAYELLSGKQPIDVTGKTIVEAARLIREHEPARLGNLRRELAGDVETIVAKAIEKERDRRYASAGELAADFRRVLNHEPILARPSSAAYQLTKFARRNKPLVAGAGVALAAIVFGGALATWQAIVATRQRNAALLAERRSTALKDFLVKDVFGSASSRVAGPNIPAGELLARAGSRIAKRFEQDPELHAEAERLMSSLQSDMGQRAAAVSHGQTRLSLLQHNYGDKDKRTLVARLDLLEMLLDDERPDDVEPVIVDFRQEIEAAFGPDSGEAQRAGTLHGLLFIQRSKLTDALRTLEGVYAAHKNHPERSLTGFYRLLSALAMVSAIRDDAEGQLRWARELLSLAETRLGKNSSAVNGARQGYAEALANNGQLDEAEAIIRRAIEDDRAILMPDDPDLVRSLGLYAIVLSRMSRYDEAEATFREIADKTNARLGPREWESFVTRRRLLTLYVRSGQDEKALKWCDDEYALQQSLSEGDSQGVLEPLRRKAQILLMRERTTEAQALLAELAPRVNKSVTLDAGTRHFLAAFDVTQGMLERRLANADPSRLEHARELIERGLRVHAEESSSSFPDISRVAEKELQTLRSDFGSIGSKPAE